MWLQPNRSNSKIQSFMDTQKDNSESRRFKKVGPYILSHVIGKGAYSTVYEAKREGEKTRFAVKQITLMTVTKKQLERIHLQIKVLTNIKHHNIVSLVEYKQTSRNLYLVFEYCKHTDLETYVQKYCGGKMPEEKARKIAIQIKKAFEVLRLNKVVHRDLKLANILVTEDFQIKIADFGFAKHLDDNEFFKSYVGTPLTMAPEIVQERNYNQKCDLWSLGIMLYQLLFGKNPFLTKERMSKVEMKNALKGELKIPPGQISEQAEDLLKRLMVREPTQRISFQQFFKHPWLSESTSVNNLNEDLLEEALRAQLKKILLVSVRKKDQKEFLQNQVEDLLAYQIIQNVKNSIENKIMFWINLGKKIMGMNYPNPRLCFWAIALLMENLQRYQNCSFVLTANEDRRIDFPRYGEIRKLQKWEMSEYTKRLPGFIERSWEKMVDYMRNTRKVLQNFDKSELDTKLQQLFLVELTSEIVSNLENKTAQQQLALFTKIKPFSSSAHFNLRISSPIFNENTIEMLLKKIKLNINNNRMYKKCQGIFKLETLYREEAQDRIYENIKMLLQ